MAQRPQRRVMGAIMKKAWVLVLWAFLQAVPAAAAELRLTCPNGGETVCLGRPLRITWLATAVSQKVRLVLRRSGSGVVGEIAANIDAAQQYYEWADAGALPGGRAEPGAGYLVRLVTMDGSLADTSNAPFSLQDCGGSGLQPGGQPPTLQIKPQFSRPDLPPLQIAHAPRLRITDFAYNYANACFECRVRNMGNAPFVGHVRWRWITDCGAREATQDIPDWDPLLPGDAQGVYHPFACVPNRGACSVHAAFSIEPFAMNGTAFERDQAEGDFPCYPRCQFLMADDRLLFMFLHGSRWVECAHEIVITANDAFDYDPDTRMATFTVGFPIKNCGNEAGREDAGHADTLTWQISHSPSNQNAGAGSVCGGGPCSSAPLAPGQGLLVERCITLKVQPGIYMLHVFSPPLSGGVLYCLVSIRFAEDLLR